MLTVPSHKLVHELVSRFEVLKAQRAEIDKTRQEIIRLVCPYRGKEGLQDKRWDTTATEACDKLSSLLHNMITPFGSRWHGLILPAKRSNLYTHFLQDEEHKILREQCETMVAELFALREVSQSGFNQCLKHFYAEVVLFGMGCFYVAARRGGGISYISVPVDSIVCSANHENVIDTVFQHYTLNAENIAKKWGEEALSPSMRSSLHHCDPQQYEFFQAVFPDERSEYSKYRSVVVCKDERRVMEEGTYRVMPYIIGRYDASSEKPYGFSPTNKALASIKRLHSLRGAISVYSETQLHKPMAASLEMKGLSFSLKPKSVNYGALGRSGEPLLREIPIGDPRPSYEEIQSLQDQIRKLYMLDLFQVFAERASRSAAESMEKTREKGIFIASIVGGLQAEFVGSMVRREIDVMLPQKGFARGELDGVKVSYTSPLYKYQRAEEVAGDIQALRIASEAANLLGNPAILAMIEPYLFGSELYRKAGMSESVILSVEDTKKDIAEQHEQSEARQMRQLAFEQSVKSGGKIVETRAEG